MRDVVAPVHQPRPVLAWIGLVPLVDVHHAVAAVDFNHRRDQHDHVRTDVLDIRRVINRQSVCQLHQRRRRARLRRVNRSRNVVHRIRRVDQRLRLRVVHPQRARIGKLRQPLVVFLLRLQQALIGNGRGDHLAAFFRVADGDNLHARRARGQHAEVLVHVLCIRQHVRCAGYIAQHLHRCRHRLRGGQIVHQRRREVRPGGVLLDLRCVGLIDRLLRIAGHRGVQRRQPGGRRHRRGRCRLRVEAGTGASHQQGKHKA